MPNYYDTTVTPPQAYCLGFVADMYNGGNGPIGGSAGQTLKDVPYGQYAYAKDVMTSGGPITGGPTNTSPKAGDMPIWGTARGKAGHIALSIGGGYAISTHLDGIDVPHLIKIADATHVVGYIGSVAPVVN